MTDLQAWHHAQKRIEVVQRATKYFHLDKETQERNKTKQILTVPA